MPPTDETESWKGAKSSVFLLVSGLGFIGGDQDEYSGVSGSSRVGFCKQPISPKSMFRRCPSYGPMALTAALQRGPSCGSQSRLGLGGGALFSCSKQRRELAM